MWKPHPRRNTEHWTRAIKTQAVAPWKSTVLTDVSCQPSHFHPSPCTPPLQPPTYSGRSQKVPHLGSACLPSPVASPHTLPPLLQEAVLPSTCLSVPLELSSAEMKCLPLTSPRHESSSSHGGSPQGSQEQTQSQSWVGGLWVQWGQV